MVNAVLRARKKSGAHPNPKHGGADRASRAARETSDRRKGRAETIRPTNRLRESPPTHEARRASSRRVARFNPAAPVDKSLNNNAFIVFR